MIVDSADLWKMISLYFLAYVCQQCAPGLAMTVDSAENDIHVFSGLCLLTVYVPLGWL